MTLRSAARSSLLWGAGAVESVTNYKSLKQPRTHFIYLHSLPNNEIDNFRSLLALLTGKMRLVSYSDAVHSASDGQPSSPQFCLSVDDAFVSNISVAKVAEEFGGSVCFFIPTGLVGTSNRQDMQKFFRTDEHIEDAALTWDDIGELRSRGHEIGSHTVTHPNLKEASRDHVVSELHSSKEELEKQIGAVDHFAWPFGRAIHAPSDIAVLAAECGYRSTASAIRGSHYSAIDLTSQYLFRHNYDSAWPTTHMAALISRFARRPT